MKIEIISGSSRKGSVTHRVALHLKKVLSEQTEHEVGIINLQQQQLPYVQSVFTSLDVVPEEYKELAQRMFAAEAFILVSPEYNGSYSPVLKNLLDHFPKQTRKPFGIVTASPGAFGGMRAAMQMQQLIYALFGIGSPHMLVVPSVEKKFDANGDLTDESFEKSVHVFVKEFLWLAEKLVAEKATV